MVKQDIYENQDIFNGLFKEEYELDRAKTKENAKALLNNYKSIAHIATCVKQPSMTQSFEISEPQFNIGQLLDDPSDKNKISKAVEKQMIAQELVQDIISGINNLYVVNKAQSSSYYKKLLYITFVDEEVYSRIDARIKLAKEFPYRIEGVKNEEILDEHLYYNDLDIALIAFANSYWSNETQSLLVYKDKEPS